MVKLYNSKVIGDLLPNVKQKVVIKKLDEDTQDQLSYLGYDLNSLVQDAANNESNPDANK